MSTETDKSQLLDDDPDGQREWRALRGTVRHQTVGMIGEIFAILRILLQDAIILVVGFAVEFAFEHWLHSEQPFFKLAINISSAMFLLLYVVMVSVHVVHYVREQFGVTAANVTGNWIPWGLAGAAVIAAVVLYNMSAFRGNQPMNSAQPDMVRFNISAGEAISPDGRHIAYSATDSSGRIVIHIRSLDALDARPLSGTEVINAYNRCSIRFGRCACRPGRYMESRRYNHFRA